MELCKCGYSGDPIIFSSTVSRWRADYQEAEDLGPKFSRLLGEDIGTHDSVFVCWALCPSCFRPISDTDDPWIEDMDQPESHDELRSLPDSIETPKDLAARMTTAIRHAGDVSLISGGKEGHFVRDYCIPSMAEEGLTVVDSNELEKICRANKRLKELYESALGCARQALDRAREK